MGPQLKPEEFDKLDQTTPLRSTPLTEDQNGPQEDALELPDVVFGTPVGVSDRTFRLTFRPDYIFSDENPRDKEITALILPAHFSPKGYFFFGHHKQLSPIIFSTFAHLKYKPRMSNKSGDDEQPSGVENLDEDGPEKEEADKAELTGPGVDDAAASDQPADIGETKPEGTGASTAVDDNKEILPNPATFARRLACPMIRRLLHNGLPSYMLSQNYRQHGTVGEFFNKQFYHNTIDFVEEDSRFSPGDKAAVKFLLKLSGKAKINGNTLLIDTDSRENGQARSFSNSTHVNYVLANAQEVDDAPMASTPALLMVMPGALELRTRGMPAESLEVGRREQLLRIQLDKGTKDH